jgi:hypothetical protein
VKRRLILIILLMVFLCGCAKETIRPEEEVPETNELEEEKETETEETEEEPDPNMIVSPLDGLRYYPEDLSKRPVALSIDNHPKARWQAGISQAEIVYEVEVEHPFTRYLCIFYAKEPERIGPVRSARPYLIYYALEYDGIFVHVGGSDDAFIEIKRLGVAEVDGLYSGALWRYYDTGKYAPHNVYTTLESIRKEAEMLDISVVLFVRGKRPGKEVIELAKENQLTILASDYTMFKACGLLVMNGMEGLEIND